MYALSIALGIGYNLWPWKKMDCKNSPLSIRPPEGWQEIIDYTHGGAKPAPARAQQILDALLHNIQAEHCDENPDLSCAVFRKPGFTLRGTDFDEFPGKGVSYGTARTQGNLYYRSNTCMDIVTLSDADIASRFAFDSGWDRLALRLQAGEFATYSVDSPDEDFSVTLQLRSDAGALLLVACADTEQELRCGASPGTTDHTIRCKAGSGGVKVQVVQGEMLLLALQIAR